MAGEIFAIRSREITLYFLSRPRRGDVGGLQGASFAAETLSAANDASSGNGEASSWPEVRHIRTYTLGHPLSVHKYVRRVWRPRLCPFIFVFSWSSGFSSFLTRGGDSECWNRIMRKFYREGRILTGLIEKFDIR